MSLCARAHTNTHRIQWPSAASDNFIQPINAHQPTGDTVCSGGSLRTCAPDKKSPPTHTYMHAHTEISHVLTDCIAHLHSCMHTQIHLTSKNRDNEGFICNFLTIQNFAQSNTEKNKNTRTLGERGYKPPFASFSAQFQLLRIYLFFYCSYSCFFQRWEICHVWF